MNPSKQDSAATDVALQQQQNLLESSLPAAFSAYDVAKKQGLASPVIFLLDCEDEIGSEIAQSWLGDQAVNDAISHRQSQAADEELDDTTTVFAHAFPLDKCRVEVPEVFPYLAPIFAEKLPVDGFLVIAVTAGGASALTVPLDAREPENS
jgi:hypothetical protein